MTHKLEDFLQVDPISEKFYDLSPFQYCSNDPIKNVDLDGAEGLDFRILTKLVENTVQNPNGTSAKVLGALSGISNSTKNTLNAIAHPLNTLDAMAKSSTPMGAVNVGLGVAAKVNAYKNGSTFVLK